MAMMSAFGTTETICPVAQVDCFCKQSSHWNSVFLFLSIYILCESIAGVVPSRLCWLTIFLGLYTIVIVADICVTKKYFRQIRGQGRMTTQPVYSRKAANIRPQPPMGGMKNEQLESWNKSFMSSRLCISNGR
jgi:hypothetical protein